MAVADEGAPLWLWLGLGALALSSSSSTEDTVRVRVSTRGRATWITAPASELGAVLGGGPPAAPVVACGPMFEHGLPRFTVFDSARNVGVVSAEPTRGQTLCVVGGRVVMVGGGLPVEGASVAIQGYPSLVEQGAPVPVQRGERTRRVALAALAGDVVALVGYTGHMDDFARELAEDGALAALYLDGGRAAHLAAPGRDVFVYSPSERPASWVTLGGR